jgi:hypothetical protein
VLKKGRDASGRTVAVLGCGLAVSKALRLAEILQSGYPDVHSQTKFATTLFNRPPKPRAMLPTVTILLTRECSVITPDKPGYNPPVPESAIVPIIPR